MGWVPAPGQLRKCPPGGTLTLLFLPFFPSRCLSWLPHLLPAAAARPPSQGIATGKYHAAVLTNSAEWEAACVKAGRRCGDLVHPLVYCPELHFSEFTSAVADMKNSVAVGVQRHPCCGERSRQSPALGEPERAQDTACGRGSSPTVGSQILTRGGSVQSGDVSLPGLPTNTSTMTGAGGLLRAPGSARSPAPPSPQSEGRPLNPHARSLGSLCAVSRQGVPLPLGPLLAATG